MSATGGAHASGTGPGPVAGPEPAPHDAAASSVPPPDLAEAMRQVSAAGRSGFSATVDATKAFRSLLSADISLARSAFGRTLAFTGVAIAFGASAWLLLMATLVMFLTGQVALSWPLSLLITAALSLLITMFGAWQAMRCFEHTRLQATRRQLARLGIGELADFTPNPGSAHSTRDYTEQVPPETPTGEPVKDERGVEVTPP